MQSEASLGVVLGLPDAPSFARWTGLCPWAPSSSGAGWTSEAGASCPLRRRAASEGPTTKSSRDPGSVGRRPEQFQVPWPTTWVPLLGPLRGDPVSPTPLRKLGRGLPSLRAPLPHCLCLPGAACRTPLPRGTQTWMPGLLVGTPARSPQVCTLIFAGVFRGKT